MLQRVVYLVIGFGFPFTAPSKPWATSRSAQVFSVLGDEGAQAVKDTIDAGLYSPKPFRYALKAQKQQGKRRFAKVTHRGPG